MGIAGPYRLERLAPPAADFDFSNRTITGYHGTGGVVEIPASINGQPVVAIGDSAFEDNGQAASPLTRVVVPNSVTVIGEYAFYGATSLASVKIGASVIAIGAGAFSGTSALARVVIFNRVVSIGHSAFENATHLPSVTLVSGFQTIGDADGIRA